ncbi:MAG: hypothetical protein SOU94_04625 [Acidaminococcus sp.]|uniref:Uncharacterized protein n=1 Tax=Acidaminococcus intestini TaxID=187327 RepID=A0A943ECI0_9FIRM|nr:hypothetical protein [Acidaminococcus sp.]MBS5518883.1 hypothetical protein [Acidaminococcus intestini]MDY2739096.1 hypothetical protein [Acidaminococcus sp.]
MPHPLPPSLRRDILRLAALQALAIPLVGGLAFMFSPQPGGWLLGCLAGWCDSALFLYGLYSGMKKAPQQAAISMHRMMFVRLGAVLVFVLIGLKLNWGGHRVLFSYLLFYGLLLIQMARKGIGKSHTD